MGYHWKNIITNRTIRYTFSSVWRSTTYCTSPQQPHLRQLFGSMEGSLGTNGLQARTTEPRPTHPSNIQTLAFRCFRMRTKNIKNKATKPNKMVVEGTKYAVLFQYLYGRSTSQPLPGALPGRHLDPGSADGHWPLRGFRDIPQNKFYMVHLCRVPPFWEAGMTLDMMFLPAFQKTPLHRYGSPMRVPPDSSAQKFWMTSICKCRVRFQTEKIAVKCQIC